MYKFESSETEKAFFDSLENSDIQHIKGSIERIDGIIIPLDDSNLINDVHCDSQCTSDANIFNFGEMYVGSAEVDVILPVENINLIKGGKLELYFRTESFLKWIPLGVWDIVSAEYKTNKITIKGYDCLNRLNTAITDNVIGAIFMKSVLKQVTKDSGVEFAQTIEELQTLVGESVDIIGGTWGMHFLPTCWDEVKTIAQFLGCFVFANREGKIEFRKFNSTPVADISAEKRFSAKINDYQYSVKGISYTDDFGQTITYAGSNGSCILGFSSNKYIWSTEKNPETAYYNDLKRIAYEVGCYQNPAIDTKWTPGEIEYYGNPALDVGDMVRIVGGTHNNSNFLITSISWKFRGPQTLISAGAPETSTTVSSGTSGSSGTFTTYTTINQTSNISAIELKKYCGEIFTERTIAKGTFSCIRETWIFIDCTMIVTGNELLTATIKINGIQQDLQPKINLNGYETLHFTLPVKISGGKHNIEILANGTAEIEQIQAIVWGQEVTAETPDITEDSDYTYTVRNNLTTVTGYTGVSLYPSIPDDLGGEKTAVIGYGAFSETKIENCYIPDGVTEIK